MAVTRLVAPPTMPVVSIQIIVMAATLQRGDQATGGRSIMKRGALDRLAQVKTEARKMARSGQYRGSGSIQMALLARGFVEASKLFTNRWTCSELDRLCKQAQEARGLCDRSLR
jgi:hypothetical protein